MLLKAAAAAVQLGIVVMVALVAIKRQALLAQGAAAVAAAAIRQTPALPAAAAALGYWVKVLMAQQARILLAIMAAEAGLVVMAVMAGIILVAVPSIGRVLAGIMVPVRVGYTVVVSFAHMFMPTAQSEQSA